MQLVIEKNGRVRGIYGEEIALEALGPTRITRASHVEPDDKGRWLADLSPVGGPVLGPFDRRSEALGAEVAWLGGNWLAAPDAQDNQRHRQVCEGAAQARQERHGQPLPSGRAGQ
jgi:hypothetical protein